MEISSFIQSIACSLQKLWLQHCWHLFQPFAKFGIFYKKLCFDLNDWNSTQLQTSNSRTLWRSSSFSSSPYGICLLFVAKETIVRCLNLRIIPAEISGNVCLLAKVRKKRNSTISQLKRWLESENRVFILKRDEWMINFLREFKILEFLNSLKVVLWLWDMSKRGDQWLTGKTWVREINDSQVHS